MCGGVHACTFMSHEGTFEWTFVFKGPNVQTVCICLIKIFTSHHQLQSVMFTIKSNSLLFTKPHFCMSSAETELERYKHVCCIYIWSLYVILVIRLLSDHKKYLWLLRTPHTDVWDSAKCKYIVQASYCIYIIWTRTALIWKFCGFALPFSLKSTIFAYSVEMRIYTPLQRHIYVFNQTANESVKMHEAPLYKYKHALNWTKNKVHLKKTCNWVFTLFTVILVYRSCLTGFKAATVQLSEL